MRLKELIIQLHRYIGIPMSVIVVTWFASGIVMMYTRGMPALSIEQSLELKSAIPTEEIGITPIEALRRNDLSFVAGELSVEALLLRPAYRFGSDGELTIFADNGAFFAGADENSGRDIVATAFAPDSSIDKLFRLLRQQRDARYVILDLKNYWDQVTVTDNDIEFEYQENSDRYYLPADTRVDYLALSVETLAAELVLDEEEIRRAYDANADRYVQPESRSVRHVLVSVDEGAGETAVEAARVKATELVDRARSGADFSVLAETHSDDAGSARRGGDLGVIQSGTMPSSFEEAAASLLEGQISDPIRTRYGFHVIQVTRLNEATLESYAEVRDRIATEIKRQEAESRFVEMAEDLGNITYEQPDNLAPAAPARIAAFASRSSDEEETPISCNSTWLRCISSPNRLLFPSASAVRAALAMVPISSKQA